MSLSLKISVNSFCRAIVRLCIVSACVFILPSIVWALEEIPFKLAPTHEKFKHLDSLRKETATTQATMQKIEKVIIREKDKSVRNDYMTVKKMYLAFLLKNKIKTKKQILEYCYAMRNCLETRMAYLKELQDVSNDDDRAEYFQMWKRSQGDYSIVASLILQYEDPEKSPVIKHGRDANKVE